MPLHDQAGTTIDFAYSESGPEQLAKLDSQSYDIVCFFAGPDDWPSEIPFHFDSARHAYYLDKLSGLLSECARIVARWGTVYLHGPIQWLAYAAVELEQQGLQFKYWIALETQHPPPSTVPMLNTHKAILLYVRNKHHFSLRKVRAPHQKCEVCGDFTADWGGKKAMRHPFGSALSDVWDDLDAVADKEHILSRQVWQRLLMLTAQEGSRILCVGYDGAHDLARYLFEPDL